MLLYLKIIHRQVIISNVFWSRRIGIEIGVSKDLEKFDILLKVEF